MTWIMKKITNRHNNDKMTYNNEQKWNNNDKKWNKNDKNDLQMI